MPSSTCKQALPPPLSFHLSLQLELDVAPCSLSQGSPTPLTACPLDRVHPVCLFKDLRVSNLHVSRAPKVHTDHMLPLGRISFDFAGEAIRKFVAEQPSDRAEVYIDDQNYPTTAAARLLPLLVIGLSASRRNQCRPRCCTAA